LHGTFTGHQRIRAGRNAWVCLSVCHVRAALIVPPRRPFNRRAASASPARPRYIHRPHHASATSRLLARAAAPRAAVSLARTARPTVTAAHGVITARESSAPNTDIDITTVELPPSTCVRTLRTAMCCRPTVLDVRPSGFFIYLVCAAFFSKPVLVLSTAV